MLYSDWILFVIYVGGYLASWCWCYTRSMEIDRWCKKEESTHEATCISFFWPALVIAHVVYYIWRVFRVVVIGLANLMQREEG